MSVSRIWLFKVSLVLVGLLGVSLLFFNLTSRAEYVESSKIAGLVLPGALDVCSDGFGASGCMAGGIRSSAFVPTNKIYDKKFNLRSQMDALEILANRGDYYASCVLARGLEICKNKDRVLDLQKIAAEDIEAASQDRLGLMVDKLELIEEVNLMCDGLTKEDLSKYLDRLVDAAKKGEVKSMSRLTSLQLTMVDGDKNFEKIYGDFHLSDAERMLNKAAFAGEPEALLNVYHAYSSGQLEILSGQIVVDVDFPKSLAAARTLAVYIDEHESEELRSFIESVGRDMSPSQEKRVRTLESMYRRNYRKHLDGKSIYSIQRDDLPEVYCAKGRA